MEQHISEIWHEASPESVEQASRQKLPYEFHTPGTVHTQELQDHSHHTRSVKALFGYLHDVLPTQDDYSEGQICNTRRPEQRQALHRGYFSSKQKYPLEVPWLLSHLPAKADLLLLMIITCYPHKGLAAGWMLPLRCAWLCPSSYHYSKRSSVSYKVDRIYGNPFCAECFDTEALVLGLACLGLAKGMARQDVLFSGMVRSLSNLSQDFWLIYYLV